LERIYVAPTWQGKNLGTQLLDFVHQYCQDAGCDSVWLTVWQENPAAVRFYERHGYTIFGIKTFQMGADPQKDWLMQRSLKTAQH
jgi:diamine N-acetyltransferase